MQRRNFLAALLGAPFAAFAARFGWREVEAESSSVYQFWPPALQVARLINIEDPRQFRPMPGMIYGRSQLELVYEAILAGEMSIEAAREYYLSPGWRIGTRAGQP